MAITTKIPDIETYTPSTGRIIGEDGLLYNLVDLLGGGGGGPGPPGPPGITLVENLIIDPVGWENVAIRKGTTIVLPDGKIFTFTADVTLSAEHLDTGSSFIIGGDYHINIGSNGVIVLSLNLTPPSGFRTIGGFHYGVNRINTIAPANVTNGIVPRSIWTLAHRPKCAPEGMLYLTGGVWVDIYLASDDGNGGLHSKYNALPVSGVENLNWYAASERLAINGKRPLFYNEFIRAAAGSPPGTGSGNQNAWSAATERATTGFVRNAVSNIGCVDCVGNLWEWLNDFIASGLGETPGWFDPMSGQGQGQVWINAANDFRAVLAGGSYFNGALIGARSICTLFSPWNDNPGFGVRGACESASSGQTQNYYL